MEEATVTAATGALGPVVAKLGGLLSGGEYVIRCRTRRDMTFIKSKLKSMHSLLWMIWEKDDLDEASKKLKMDVWDLADDTDDVVDDFVLSLKSQKDISRHPVQPMTQEMLFQHLKKRADDVWEQCRKKWKLETAQTISSLFSRKKDTISHPVKPRAHPFVRKDASEIVGMDGPRDKLIKHLVGEDENTPVPPQLKMVSIVGMAGMGKTTLSRLVYEEIENKFQVRVFVSLTPTTNTREVLTCILDQVAADSIPLPGTKAATEEQLIDIISNFLNDKRYLVIIDDIWHSGDWETIRRSLPENNLGSRIVTTTRVHAIADKCHDDFDALVYKLDPQWDRFSRRWVYKFEPQWDHNSESWVYKSGTEDVGAQVIAMKAETVGEGFDGDHHILHMCGGTPLALLCVLSALAKEREHQEQQGMCVNTRDVQDRIYEQIMQNGIQNTSGFEPLVESLQLSYDDLPNHMLKTCLLYCSIYPQDFSYGRKKLVRRWKAEGFVSNEEAGRRYFDELADRGFIQLFTVGELRYMMHPMMRNFLGWKSRENNFIAWSCDISSSYNSRVRRLCIDYWRSNDALEQADPISGIDWSHIRSLVVFQCVKSVPLEKLERLHILDLQRMNDIENCHLKDICGLVRVRHLLGLQGREISEIPPEIVSLQQLKTLDMSRTGIRELPSWIGNLHDLENLHMRSSKITELPREIEALQQLKTLDVSFSLRITELPKEIGKLQQLETLNVSRTYIRKLPSEIWDLQNLQTLDLAYMGSGITELPRAIVKLQHLEELYVNHTDVRKIPGEIGGLKKLKIFQLDSILSTVPWESAQLQNLNGVPQCIRQACKKSDLLSLLAGEVLSLRLAGRYGWPGLIVGKKHMHIPLWIKDHFNDLAMLDIRMCKLEEQDLKILRQMPSLCDLKVRLEVVPRKPIAISGDGFARLKNLTVDSRIPRVTFQEGAMPNLEELTFEFHFYGGTPNKDPMGINHLTSLKVVCFECNKDWYTQSCTCIRATIEAVRKEVQEHPNSISFRTPRLWEEFKVKPDNSIFSFF